MPHTQLIIHVDTREKTPLPFPAHISLSPSSIHHIYTTPVLLPAGDYCLQGESELCLIERKANLLELGSNLFTRDRTRFLSALSRLSSTTANPYLLLEAPSTIFLSSSSTTIPHHDKPIPDTDILQSLLNTLADYRVRPLFIQSGSTTSRRAAGHLLLRTLYSHSPQRVPAPSPPAFTSPPATP